MELNSCHTQTIPSTVTHSFLDRGMSQTLEKRTQHQGDKRTPSTYSSSKFH